MPWSGIKGSRKHHKLILVFLGCYNAFMPLTLKEVEHIASLARLRLTKEEILRFRDQLSQILDYAARLQGVKTEGIPPTSSVLPLRSVLRPDKSRQGLNRDELLKNAPQVEDDQFQVPAIFE